MPRKQDILKGMAPSVSSLRDSNRLQALQQTHSVLWSILELICFHVFSPWIQVLYFQEALVKVLFIFILIHQVTIN